MSLHAAHTTGLSGAADSFCILTRPTVTVGVSSTFQLLEKSKVKIVVSTVSQLISLSGKTLFCTLSQSGFITKSRKNIWISFKKIHIIFFICTHHKHPWEIYLLMWNCRLLDDIGDSKCSQKRNVLCQCEHAAFKLLYLFTKTSRCTVPSHNSSICYLIGPDLTAADWLKTLH